MIEVLLSLILAATGITRTVAPDLTVIAEQRAAEVSTDATFSHDLMRGGTAEVLAWNSGAADPAASALRQWRDSPVHWAILTDPSLVRIGCGHATGQDGRDVFACVLDWGGSPQTQAIVPAPPAEIPPTQAPTTQPPLTPLPDTALPPP